MTSFSPFDRQRIIVEIILREGEYTPQNTRDGAAALRMADRGLLHRDVSRAPIYSYTLKETLPWPEPLKTLLEDRREAAMAAE